MISQFYHFPVKHSVFRIQSGFVQCLTKFRISKNTDFFSSIIGAAFSTHRLNNGLRCVDFHISKRRERHPIPFGFLFVLINTTICLFYFFHLIRIRNGLILKQVFHLKHSIDSGLFFFT